MKKTYMIPTLKVVEIKPNQLMITVSGQYAGEEIQAREARFSDWDEEGE